ncbi:thioredoxin [Haloarchaeobius baliensis]|uniref:thioredoxin n=1 Tax=Haloarchaeobius baliensis TaxID=1670458 RepID=UPI003F8814CB
MSDSAEANDAAGTSTTEPVHIESGEHLQTLLTEEDVVLVDFYADWCGPCKMLEPVVADIAAETDATVAKVDIDERQALAQENGIRGVPTLLLYANGELAERMVGVQEKSSLVDRIEQHG